MIADETLMSNDESKNQDTPDFTHGARAFKKADELFLQSLEFQLSEISKSG